MNAHPSRRRFLRNASLIAMAPTVPSFLSGAAAADSSNNDGRILVVIQLSGGNDGINTVVPFTDEGYAIHRRELRLSDASLIKVNGAVALHPAMRSAADLLEDGRLSIVQGVGYPNPNRSHEVSMAIWQTARFDATEHTTFGWLGRAMDQRLQISPRDVTAGGVDSVLLGEDNPPVALRGRRSTSLALAHLGDLTLKRQAVERPSLAAPADDAGDVLSFARRASLDAYAASELLADVTARSNDSAAYPSTRLAGRLKSIAQLIKAGFGPTVYYAIQPGYDTHAAQLPTHARLLRELADGLRAFQDDLKEAGLDHRVLTLCFSEFGRRAAENGSIGTDHGTCGPVFLAGPSVNAGPFGKTPGMTDLTEGGDQKAELDFRQVYATVLRDWLSVSPEKILGGKFASLDLLRVT